MEKSGKYIILDTELIPLYQVSLRNHNQCVGDVYTKDREIHVERDNLEKRGLCGKVNRTAERSEARTFVNLKQCFL